MIDLKHFQYVSVDHGSWIATVGAGIRLDEVTKQLFISGKRAIPHGTCPSVGIGGHATIGGLGPNSRMWGATLDHIQEMTVVIADSSVVTVSESQNPDMFFALRGAAAGFGIVVEFKFRTFAAPEEAVQFSHTLTGNYGSMADTLKDWQTLISNPLASHRLFSQTVITKFGLTIVGTYFGSEDEFREQPFAQRFVYPQLRRPKLTRAGSSNSLKRIFQPKKNAPRIDVQVYTDNWLGLIREWAGGRLLSRIIGRPSHFYHKSLIVRQGQEISAPSIEELLAYLDSSKKGTPMWFIILDLAGGAVNDIAADATAFPHRDTSFFYQSYAISLGKVSETSKSFIRSLHEIVEKGLPDADNGIYPGYVDPELREAQEKYWRGNLERLEMVKEKFDPGDVFRNPQSVRPAGTRK